jgi:hypothetical protein
MYVASFDSCGTPLAWEYDKNKGSILSSQPVSGNKERL